MRAAESFERSLGGVDRFHLVHDAEMRSRGLPGNHCVYVVELDGRLDASLVGARLGRAAELVPELRWRLVHRLGVAPTWRATVPSAASPVPVVEGTSRGVLGAAEDFLAQRVDGVRPWRVSIARGAHRDALLLSWFHPLADAKGAERLLRWLGSGDAQELDAPPPAADRFKTSSSAVDALSRDERLALARAYGAHVLDSARAPATSLADVVPRGRVGRRQRALRVVLSAEETRVFDRRVRERAKLAETSLMALAAARSVDAELRARGLAPAHHLVPVPLSLDPKGAGGARFFGNHLTMMLLSIDRDDLADDRRGAAHLAEQQRAIVRQKLDVGMIAGLELARALPSFAYRWLRDRPFPDAASSLIVSNPGTIALDRFAGLPVVDAYPLPAAVLPPGFQAIFSRHAGRVSVQMVFVDGVLDDAGSARAAERMRRDLAG